MKQTAKSFLACARPRPTPLEVERFMDDLAGLKPTHKTVSGEPVYQAHELGPLFDRVRNDKPLLKQWLQHNHADKTGKIHALYDDGTARLKKLNKRDRKLKQDYKVNHS